MLKRLTLLVAVVALAGATLTARADDKAVRKELESRFAALAKADETSDIKAYLAILTLDYRYQYRDVKYESAESLRSQFAFRSKTDPKRTIRYTIGELKVSGQDAVATVTRDDKWSYTKDGKTDHYERVMKFKSAWVKTTSGWKLKHDDELEYPKHYANGKLE